MMSKILTNNREKWQILGELTIYFFFCSSVFYIIIVGITHCSGFSIIIPNILLYDLDFQLLYIIII